MIRKYKSEDIDAVISSWRAASEFAHPFLSTAFLDQEADNVRNVYMAYAETWVCVAHDRVVGFIALIDNEVGGLFVDPGFHGQGFGRALVNKAVVEKGALSVAVFEKNVIGRRFYNAYGFCGAETSLHESSGQTTVHMTYTPKNR